VSNDFAGTSTPWTESTLNAGNAPVVGNRQVGTLGSVVTGQFVEVNVTSVVAGNGVVSFAIASTSPDLAKYDTKEGDHLPELVVTSASTNAISVSKERSDLAGRTLLTIDPAPQLPEKIELHPNFPNPFNAGTTIEYGLPESSHVRLLIYNLLGQRVRTLFDASEGAGVKRVKWDGKNQLGRDVGSGLYFVRLEIGQTRLTRQIALEK